MSGDALAAAADALARRLAALEADPGAVRDAVQREVGWAEAVAHLARRGGLTHAGLVEARELVEAGRDWAREHSGEGPGHAR